MQLTSTHTISSSPTNECLLIVSSWMHLSFWSGCCVEGVKMRTTFTCIGVGDICHFYSLRKTYHDLCGSISGNYRKTCFCDDLSVQNLLDELRSWGAGLKPFTLSLILLQCHPGSGGILWGHYSWLKIINMGVKIVPVNNLRLVPMTYKSFKVHPYLWWIFLKDWCKMSKMFSFMQNSLKSWQKVLILNFHSAWE